MPARSSGRAERRGHARERAAYNARLESGAEELALHAAINALHDAADDRPDAVRGPAPRAAAAGNDGRWVPIGPSVIRRGQAEDRPHVVGRIRDLVVSDDGRRAYAASAKGGLWYSEDAGSTWSPVGAWIGGHRRAGGNSSVFVCGALLVAFGASQSQDFVMVGTGELSPFFTSSGSGRVGGIGVLTARGPAGVAETNNPWEPDTGLSNLEGLGIFRLARRPGRTPGAIDAAGRDEVLAATSRGLFRGIRRTLPAAPANPPFPALPAREGFEWTRVPGVATDARVTDVLWITKGSGTRIVVLLNGQGVRFSDDDGNSFSPLPTLHRPAVPVTGRSSIAVADGNRAYVLYDGGAGPAVARIPDLTATPPVATPLTGVPKVWTDGGARDYDQAIAAERFSGTDRIYLGGNWARPKAQACASLWAMDVDGGALKPRPGVSDTGAPPAAGADRAGLVGNNVHADVHTIVLPGASSARRPVWVACDGGVYVSSDNGRVNSFAAMNTGLAVSETGFIDSHPTASHFLATGLQDNGTAVRAGDTVWEAIHLGDGGGLAFAPTAPSTLVAQYIRGYWRSTDTHFRDPLTRSPGGPNGTITNHPEYTGRAEFYSGCATIRIPGVPPAPDTTRFALGTDRVYLSDTIGSGSASTWVILPIVPATAPASRADATGDPSTATQTFGVVGGSYGPIVSMEWISPKELIVLYRRGILRLTEDSAGAWRTDRIFLDPPNKATLLPKDATLTEVAVVPGTRHFYVTANNARKAGADTVYFVHVTATGSTLHAAGLRAALQPTPGNGPLDPAYSVVVDPGAPTTVYVGTKTGVWRSTRTNLTGGHGTWVHYVNGLPEATVQDLSIWTPQGGSGPRLLRAAIQSRGVWETDLAAATPVVTYLRCHSFDDRRGPLPGPSPRSSTPLRLPLLASPDIAVRPAWPVTAAPTFPQVLKGVPDNPLSSATAGAFHTWTFQTAFRWWYPSVRADGQWPDAFADLIEHDRAVRAMPAGRTITKELWNAVVGGTRLRVDSGKLVRSTVSSDSLAVFRPPWQTTFAPDLVASEVDIMECVVPPTVNGDVWQVRAAPSVVEVLLHHRASKPTAAHSSFAGLMWRELSGSSIPMMDPGQDFVTWWTRVATTSGSPPTPPAGWSVVPAGPSSVRHTLGVGLEARLPRAVPIPIDLRPLAGKVILLAAFAASVADTAIAPAPTATLPLFELAKSWPHIALRLIQVI